ncbi:MAG: FeoB-associated Cys-rich membrane protein [Winogradskyella sp.]|nr:FeoB-associated Cys-rich membrane protein [Winogradskyella sp.]RNC88274.1 MAG: FeoB-associated Cys-rich membrane protein [Winogradskyella sp.]
MNTVLQNILAFSALSIALLFLFKTFVWWPKKKAKKACGETDCGCH